MPSVGMRRSTRVFVPKSVVKDAEGERVLRSGKRFSSESAEGKAARDNGDDWLRRLDNGDSADVPCYKNDRWDKVVPEQDIGLTNFSVKQPLQESANSKSEIDDSKDKMYGVVYHRKRRRSTCYRFDCHSQLEDDGGLGDRMYGIPFVRKQRRKRVSGNSLAELLKMEGISGVGRTSLDVVVESSCNSAFRFARFLVSVLNFMRRARLRMSGLTAIMCSEPIAQVFSKHGGIHFSQDLSCWKNNISPSGICQIFGSRQFIPLFSLEFSVIPFLFMSLHSSILLQSVYLPNVLLRYLTNGVLANKECHSCTSTEIVFSGSNFMASGSSGKKRKADVFVEDIDLAGRNASTSHHANSWNIPKRARSSMRIKRKINLSLVPVNCGILHSNINSHNKINRTSNKKGGAVGANLFGVGDTCTSLSTSRSNQKHRKTVQKSPCNNIKHNMDSVCCNANVLVIESDRCYRENGAKVTLGCLASKYWYLVVKKHGLAQYMHKAQREMRPCTANRYTHAVIWTGENGWKLEFSNRQDWLVFKELHSECINRNMKVASSRTIPVPGVREVPDYGAGRCVPFIRPVFYITVHDDQVARALMRKTANYDLDSSDEEWLEKLNKCLCDRDDGALKLSAEKFEEIIDELEKAAYYFPDDALDENRASCICSDLGRRDIFADVYQYWLKKRKQKRLALLRVFQFPPRRKSKLVQEPVSCKKKLFKKQVSQSGRGKQKSSLRVKQEDAKKAIISANRSMESAMLKRKRAQIIMDNADLATYKAVMALKIAEASQLSEYPENYVSFILSS